MAFIRAFRPRLKRISPYFVASDRRVGGSLMRVYRDTRFAKGGEPYKTNVGIQFRHEQGRDIMPPASTSTLRRASVFWPLVCGGRTRCARPGPAGDCGVARPLASCPRRPQVRGAISLEGDSLKRPPRGFPADHL